MNNIRHFKKEKGTSSHHKEYTGQRHDQEEEQGHPDKVPRKDFKEFIAKSLVSYIPFIIYLSFC
jgi:hypothetical protein